MVTSIQELDKFLDRRASIFKEALLNIARARLNGGGYYEAIYDLAEVMRRTMILSDLHGRRRTLLEFDRVKRQGRFSQIPETTPIVPHVEFVEAVDDLLTREPRLAASMDEVSRLYSSDHVFVMAKAAAGNVDERVAKARTEAVQAAITRGVSEGRALYEEAAIIREIGPWTQAYAETVYRTNVASSYNQGRIDQAKDEDIKEVIPAMKFVSLHDSRTRPNHAAADGFIAPIDHPAWRKLHPPLGYNCRCAAQFVSIFTLERMGLVKDGKVIPYFPPGFQNAKPDAGFKVGDFSGVGL